MKRITSGSPVGTWRRGIALVLAIIAVPCLLPLAAEEKPAAEGAEQTPGDLAEKMRAIFPHITIHAKERHVDVESQVCLEEGYLELVVCGKDSKEHESLIMVEAKPSHIHAALLLIGAKPGNPAMQKPLDEEGNRWAHLPPRGQPVKVSLVYQEEGKEPVERPIGDFIAPTEDESGLRDAGGAEQKFPDSFLFTGSHMHGEGDDRKYIADMSGHVVSIATFGDEVLSLSEVHAQDNGSLSWQIKPDTLPKLGTKVILRLRPQWAEEPANE